MDATLQAQQAIAAQCPRCGNSALKLLSRTLVEIQLANDDRPRVTTSYECQRCRAVFVDAR